jgi:hypothetical protein
MKCWTIFCSPLMIVFVLLFFSPGCVDIPMPQSESSRTQSHVDPQVLKEFIMNKTTFAEVTNRLGEPDAISPDERQVAYRTEKITGMRLALIPGQDNGPDPVYTDRFYFFEFDDQGHLKNTRQTIQKNLTTKWPDHTAFQEASERYIPLVQSEYSAYLPAGEPAWRVQECDWMPGETGSKGFHAFRPTAIPGRLFITESNLYFFSTAQLANAGPACKVPFDSITEVRAPCNESGRPAGLVVFDKTSGTNAFALCYIGGPKNSPVTADFEFIRSKIQTNQPGK